MATIRVHKTKNYTVMSNTHLRDKNLSLKAKGLLSVMLSLPDNWEYSIAGLVAISKENETAVKSALNELKDNNYVVVIKEKPTKNNGGRIKYSYDVYEEPKKQGTEKQGVENLVVEFQGVESNTQLNTKESSTNKQNTDILNIKMDNTSSNDDGKVNTSFSENDEKPKLTKSELKKKQKDMSKRFYDICDVSIGHGGLKEAVNNAFNLYLDLFTEKTGKIHPILRNETLIDVCSALSHINDKEFNHFEEFDFSKPKEDGTMPLEEMVRLHFARSHNGKTDYSIAHFCNKKYLLKLAQFVMS